MVLYTARIRIQQYLAWYTVLLLYCYSTVAVLIILFA